MTIAFAQQSGANSTASGTTATRALTGVASNSLLILVCTNREPSDLISSVSDTVNGAWSASVASNSDGSTRANFWYFIGSASGNPTVTATFNQSLGSPAVCNLIEFTATGTVQLDASVNTQDNAATTSHSHGSIDISAAGLILGTCGLSGGDSSGYSAATNYTKLDTGSGLRIMSQYRIATGSLTGETATWSSGVDSINTAAIIAAFIEAAAGGSQPPRSMHQARLRRAA